MSVLLPKHLQSAFISSVTDPDQLNLSRELAIVDTNVHRLITKLSDSEEGTLFSRLLKMTPLMSQALKEWKDAGKYATAMNLWEQMVYLIAEGSNDEATWVDIQQALETRRRLTESEVKRRIALKAVATADQMDTFLVSLMHILKEEIADAGIRGRIGRRIQALASGAPSQAPQPSKHQHVGTPSRSSSSNGNSGAEE